MSCLSGKSDCNTGQIEANIFISLYLSDASFPIHWIDWFRGEETSKMRNIVLLHGMVVQKTKNETSRLFKLEKVSKPALGRGRIRVEKHSKNVQNKVWEKRTCAQNSAKMELGILWPRKPYSSWWQLARTNNRKAKRQNWGSVQAEPENRIAICRCGNRRFETIST